MSQSITLTWEGRSYPVAPTMELILAVEDVVTLGQLAKAAAANDPPLGKIARAYATALRMAGVTVDDIDVYRSMFGAGADMAPIAAVNRLLSLLVPPDALAARETPAGNSPAPADTGAPATSSSPKKRSRRRSEPAGAHPSSSGA